MRRRFNRLQDQINDLVMADQRRSRPKYTLVDAADDTSMDFETFMDMRAIHGSTGSATESTRTTTDEQGRSPADKGAKR